MSSHPAATAESSPVSSCPECSGQPDRASSRFPVGSSVGLGRHFGEHVDGDPRFSATDGGVAQARSDEGDVTDSGDGPSAVHSDDDPRTKRAKREDIELRAGLVPRPDGQLPEKARPNTQ